MAVNKDSTGFTLFFAVAMVVVVGTILAYLATSLKPLQQANAADKKRMDILASIGLDDQGDDAVTRDNVNTIFPNYITGYYLLDNSGSVTETDKEKVFAVDVKKQHRNTQLKDTEKKYPLFKGKLDDGKEVYIVPVVGKGLWGPIWGYLAMESDMTTICGASFDHKTETPGLGAEIKTNFFEKNWVGQTFNYQEEAYFRVTKGAGSSSGKHQVDGITGGTITSVGVEEMVNRTMAVYKQFDTSKAQLIQ